VRTRAGRLGATLGWAWVVGACAAGDSHGTPGRPAAPGVGETFSAVQLSGDRPALVWIFGVEQCLACELDEAARVVRGLQRRLGERVETVVMAVGNGDEGDRDIVRGFLASRRISGRVEMRGCEPYPEGLGAAPVSVLYVMNRHSVVEAAVAADSAEIWRSADGRLDLANFVARLAEREGSAGRGGTGMW